MSVKGKLISEVLLIAEKAGLNKVTPIELSNGANLIIHLDPHPIVARIATVLSKEDAAYAYKILDRELRVARHLQSKGVPVLLPSDPIDAGPYDIGGTWLTFWEYVPQTHLKPPSPSEAVELVNTLSLGMKDFSCEIPLLGVWERTCESVNRLMNHPDQRIQALLDMFVTADRQMRLDTSLLIPCHGDAHTRNLLPSPEGWIWADFEDLSLMPAYWDLASFVGNLALFSGVQEPTFKYILSQINNGPDLAAFGFAVTARILMSTLGNLDFALSGNGDLEFAFKQLELAEDFIHQIDLIIQGNGGVH
ncbi:aminoglycoside phosphotransferase family protein [Paenibacillus sp. FJAT-26967]|uniref:aminoglycoside phosphotransferase family protein n=1 Tax=Paenibacillus sp. FJAT-26967 TaxID=1729690 RepID=UPI000838757C|nr:aminoglycoside phosphotransferase family protein [Paenibacillus sp. FJAT-26967]